MAYFMSMAEQGLSQCEEVLHTEHVFWMAETFPDSKVHGANMGPIWDRQDPGGPHVGPMNLAIWVTDWNLYV